MSCATTPALLVAEPSRNGARLAGVVSTIAVIAAIEGLLELDAVVKGAPGRGGGDAQHRLAFALWIGDHVAPGGAVARITTARR